MVKHVFGELNRITNALAGRGRSQDSDFVIFSFLSVAVLGFFVLVNSATTSSRLRFPSLAFVTHPFLTQNTHTIELSQNCGTKSCGLLFFLIVMFTVLPPTKL